MNIKLTPEGENFEIGFKGTFGPLKDRKEDDLKFFLIEAHRAKREDYLAFFDNPPSLAELLAAETRKKLADNQDGSVYNPHPLTLPAGTVVKSAAPATEGEPANAGETATSGASGSGAGTGATTGGESAGTGTGRGASAFAVTVVQGLANRAD